MKEITRSVLKNIKKLKVGEAFVVSHKDLSYCPQVNSLVLLGLYELGYKQNTFGNQDLGSSSLFDKRIGLFHKRTDCSGVILQEDFNVCKNSIAALWLAVSGRKNEAKQIMQTLFDSAAFDSEKSLFFREFNVSSGNINKMIITQTNLWAAIALNFLGDKRGKKILSALEQEKLDKKEGLFGSQNCKIHSAPKTFFSDDQALAIIAYCLTKQEEKAKSLCENLLKSKLYSKKTCLFNTCYGLRSINYGKSTYKNGLCGIALGKAGFEKERKALSKAMSALLFDKRTGLFNGSNYTKTKYPDSNVLALMAIEYLKIKHEVF